MADRQEGIPVQGRAIFGGIDLLVGPIDTAAQQAHEYAAAIGSLLNEKALAIRPGELNLLSRADSDGFREPTVSGGMHAVTRANEPAREVCNVGAMCGDSLCMAELSQLSTAIGRRNVDYQIGRRGFCILYLEVEVTVFGKDAGASDGCVVRGRATFGKSRARPLAFSR